MGVAECWAHSYPSSGKAFQKGFKFKKQRFKGISHLLPYSSQEERCNAGNPCPYLGSGILLNKIYQLTLVP